MRPRFTTDGYSQTTSYNLEFQNTGTSPATDVVFKTGVTKDVIRRADIIPAGATITVTVNILEMRVQVLRYSFAAVLVPCGESCSGSRTSGSQYRTCAFGTPPVLPA